MVSYWRRAHAPGQQGFVRQRGVFLGAMRARPVQDLNGMELGWSRVVRAAQHAQRQSRGRPPCQPGASRPGSGSMVARESSLTSWRHAPVAKPMSMSKPMHQSKKVLRPDLVRQGRACSANQHLHAARAIPAGSAHNDEQGRASRRRSSRIPVQREGAS